MTSLRIPIIDDVCDVPEIKEKVCKIFYYKLLDKWLYDIDDSGYILGYLKIVDGKASLIKNIEHKDDYKSTSQSDTDKKVSYIEDNVFKLDDVAEVLKKFVAGTRISWCKLPKSSSFVRESIEKSLVNKLKKLISDKKSD